MICQPLIEKEDNILVVIRQWRSFKLLIKFQGQRTFEK